jgi:hypothetical protein
MWLLLFLTFYGSLKIRPPEITLAAWVRDMRIPRYQSQNTAPPFTQKLRWMLEGEFLMSRVLRGFMRSRAAHEDALFIKPLQYSGGYATADHGQVDAGAGGLREGPSYRETNNRVNDDRRT